MSDFRILISGNLNKKQTESNIKKQLSELEKKLSLKISYDKSDIKQMNQAINQTATNSKKVSSEAATQIQLFKSLQKEAKIQEKQALTQLKYAEQGRKEKEKILQYEQRVRLAIEKSKQKEKERTIELQKQLDLYKQKMLGGNGFAGELDIFVSKNKGQFDKDALEKIRKDIDELTIKTPELNKKMKQTGIQFASIKQEASQAGSVMQRTFENAFKFLRFYLIGGILVRFAGLLRDGAGAVIELDGQLKTLRITMDANDASMNRLVSSAQNMAKELGTTVTNVMEVAKVYANINESVDSILAKTRPSIILSNLSGLGVTETTDALQAMMNQFDLTDEHAMMLVDSLTKVSASMKFDFGRGIQGITEAIQVSGSAAKESGFEIQRYEAIVGSLIERTRLGGSTVGAALRTIMARISRANSDDVTAEDISKAEAAYKSLGISIRETSGEFKDMDDTLTDLASIWGSLNDVQRSYIAEVSAGVRRKDIFLNMMRSWTTSTELYTEALNSNGFALERNEAHLDSVNGKSQRFMATLNTMWQNTINSDSIKSLIDMGTALVSLTDKVGLLTVAFTILFTVLQLKGITTIAIGFLDTLSLSIGSLITKLGIGQAAAISFATVLSTILPVAIATGAIIAINALSKAHENYIKRLNESIDTLKSDIEQNEQEKKSLERLASEYNNLLKKTDKTIQERNRLKELNNQLIKTYPDLNTKIDAEGKLHLITAEAIKKANDARVESIKLNKQQIIETRKDLLESQKKSIANEFLTKNSSSITSGIWSMFFGTADRDEFSNNLKKLQQDIVDIQESTGRMSDVAAKAIYGIKDEFFNRFSEGIQNGKININEFGSEWDKIVSGLNGSKVQNAVENYQKALDNKNVDDTTTSYNKLNEALKNVSGGLINARDLFGDINEAISKTPQNIGGSTQLTNLEYFQNKLKDYQFFLNSGLNNTKQYYDKVKKLRQDLIFSGLIDSENPNDAFDFNRELILEEKSIKNQLEKEIVNPFDSAYSDLRQQRRMEEINTKAYYDALLKLYNEYENTLTKQQQDDYKYELFQLTKQMEQEKLKVKEEAYKIDKENLEKALEANSITTEQYYKKLEKLKDEYFPEYSNLSNEEFNNMLFNASPDIAEQMQEYLELVEELNKTAAESKKSAFEEAYDEIQYLRDKDKLNTQKYYDELSSIYKKHKETLDLDEQRKIEVELHNLREDLLKQEKQSVEEIIKLYKQKKDALIETEELIEQAIRDSLELEKDSLEKTIENIEKEVEEKLKADKKYVESEKEKYNKAYEVQKNALQREKDLLQKEFDEQKYQKKVKEQEEDIVKLEKQYQKIAADNSGRYEKEKQELRDEIADKHQDLLEFQQEHEIETISDGIDEKLRLLEEEKDRKEELWDEATDILDKVYKNREEKGNRYYRSELQKSKERLKEINASLDKESTVIANKVSALMSSTQTEILNFLTSNLEQFKNAGVLQAEALLAGYKETLNTAGIVSNSISKGSGLSPTDRSNIQAIIDAKTKWTDAYNRGDVEGQNSAAQSAIDNYDALPKEYADILRSMNLEDSIKWFNSLPKYHNGGEVIAKLKEGEGVLKPIEFNAVRNLAQLLGKIPALNFTPSVVMPKLSGVGGGSNGDLTINELHINVDGIANDMDIKDVASKVMQEIHKQRSFANKSVRPR